MPQNSQKSKNHGIANKSLYVHEPRIIWKISALHNSKHGTARGKTKSHISEINKKALDRAISYDTAECWCTRESRVCFHAPPRNSSIILPKGERAHTHMHTRDQGIRFQAYNKPVTCPIRHENLHSTGWILARSGLQERERANKKEATTSRADGERGDEKISPYILCAARRYVYRYARWRFSASCSRAAKVPRGERLYFGWIVETERFFVCRSDEWMSVNWRATSFFRRINFWFDFSRKERATTFRVTDSADGVANKIK